MGFFDFSLLDVWNRPEMQILRKGTKITAKAISSASAKADDEAIGTSEVSELLSGAQLGNSNAQCALALHYIKEENFEKAVFWLEKSAAQGNEHALAIIDHLQN